jgi:hypothetical protein
MEKILKASACSSALLNLARLGARLVIGGQGSPYRPAEERRSHCSSLESRLRNSLSLYISHEASGSDSTISSYSSSTTLVPAVEAKLLSLLPPRDTSELSDTSLSFLEGWDADWKSSSNPGKSEWLGAVPSISGNALDPRIFLTVFLPEPQAQQGLCLQPQCVVGPTANTRQNVT